MRLKLNASKTELIWFTRRTKNENDLAVQIDKDCCIQPSDVVRDLGVLLDNTLSMTNNISSVTKSCFFHLRRIRQIKRCLNEKCLRTLVQALVISRLDYTATPFWSTYQTPHFIHTPLSSTVLHDSSKAWSQEITSPQLFGNSTGFPSKREFHSKSVSSCSTSIPSHLRAICHPWSHRAQKSNRDRVSARLPKATT